jgi:translation initiation factor IF-3
VQKFSRNGPPQRTQPHRTNLQIRVLKVRVMQDGQPLGIMPTYEARKLATEAGLDLVEIAPHAEPPVCHIMDYGKFKYEDSIKKKEQKKKAKSVQEKEIQLSPGIGGHDIATKLNHAKDFLEEGRKVQIVLKFHGRENAHRELGMQVIKDFIESLSDVAGVELPPRFEGKKLLARIEPKKDEKR